MGERAAQALRRTGLPLRFSVAIALIVLAALAVTFVFVYRGTGSELRNQIDKDLAKDERALAQAVTVSAPLPPAALAAEAQRYIDSQPSFGASSELMAVQVRGAPPATNEPDLLAVHRRTERGETAGEHRVERGEAHAIDQAADGYSTLPLADVGEVRLLKMRLSAPAGLGATIILGQPLSSVTDAQAGVRRNFLLVGSLALASALLVGAIVATRLGRPLRQMADTAGAVDAGELELRIAPQGSAEVRRLGESFNNMLERLEDAFRRQRAFVSDASHELRTPLTAIRGQIEVLARARDPSAEQRAATAGVVAREVERMQRLIDDMLALAESDEGLVHSPAPVEVATLLEDAIANLPSGQTQELRITAAPGGVLSAEADRIVQVLRNVIRNAIEHSPSTGVISIAATAHDSELRITVDDSGPGIPPGQRTLVFERFYRSDSSRSRRGGGSGLGLAIAKAIVEAHSGRIWVEESLSGGARIAVQLPRFEPR